MSKAYDIAGYTYNANNYCVDCILFALGGKHFDIGWVYNVEGILDLIAAVMAIDREDENTFDSSTFPKVIFYSQIENEERCSECNIVL